MEVTVLLGKDARTWITKADNLSTSKHTFGECIQPSQQGMKYNCKEKQHHTLLLFSLIQYLCISFNSRETVYSSLF